MQLKIKKKMLYLHCEGGMIVQGGFYDLYYKVGERHQTKQLLHTIRQLKMDSENVLESIKLDEVVIEKLKTKGVKTIQEAVHSGHVHKTTVLFDDFELHLEYWRLRRRVTFFLAKCFECMVQCKFKLYTLYKKSLMEDWPEMLELSPNDQVAVKTAERMKLYYDLLCENENRIRSNR